MLKPPTMPEETLEDFIFNTYKKDPKLLTDAGLYLLQPAIIERQVVLNGKRADLVLWRYDCGMYSGTARITPRTIDVQVVELKKQGLISADLLQLTGYMRQIENFLHYLTWNMDIQWNITGLLLGAEWNHEVRYATGYMPQVRTGKWWISLTEGLRFLVQDEESKRIDKCDACDEIWRGSKIAQRNWLKIHRQQMDIVLDKVFPEFVPDGLALEFSDDGHSCEYYNDLW